MSKYIKKSVLSHQPSCDLSGYNPNFKSRIAYFSVISEKIRIFAP